MKKNYLYLLILSMGIFSCSKYELDFNKFNEYAPTVEFALPLAYSNLKIANLVKNNQNYSYLDRTNLIHVLVRDDSTFEYSNNKITEIKSQTLTSIDTNLGFLDINNNSITENITLRSLLDDFSATNRALLASLDNTLNIFPAFSDSTRTIKKFTPFNNFSLMYIKSGFLDFEFTNFIPTTIDSIVFDVYNALDNKLIFSSITLNNIIPNEKKSVRLKFSEGTLVNNEFLYKIRKIKTFNSPNPVQISLEAFFSISINLFNLKLGAGSAKLPNQTVQTFTRSATMSSNALGIKFFNIAFDTAQTFISGSSSINTPLEVKIKFLNAKKNNLDFPEQTIYLPANQPFNFNAIDFSKVQFLFDKNPDQPNIVNFEIKINVIGSGNNFITFDSSQRFNFNLSLPSAKLLYVVGIFKDTTSTYLTKAINNTELKKISSGFKFDSTSLTINTTNSIGIPFNIEMSLVGNNADNTATFNDKFAPFQINNPFVPNNVTPLNYNNFTFAKTALVFSNYGENKGQINEFISLPVTTGIITAKVNINTALDVPSYAAIGQKLYIGTLIDIPLILNAYNVVLTDTINFDSKSFDGLDSAVMGLNIDNGFPFKADLKIYFMNASNVIVDSTTINSILLPSSINTNGRTIAPTRSKSNFSLSKSQISNLIKQKANKIVLKATLFTPNDGTSQVKIYNDYFMNIKFGIVTKITLTN